MNDLHPKGRCPMSSSFLHITYSDTLMKKHFQEYRNLHLGTKLYKRHYIGQYLEIAKILAKI